MPTVCSGKERLVGFNWTTPLPEPFRFNFCVLPGRPLELSVYTTLAVSAPVLVGLNVTVVVHEAPAASVDGEMGQLLV